MESRRGLILTTFAWFRAPGFCCFWGNLSWPEKARCSDIKGLLIDMCLFWASPEADLTDKSQGEEALGLDEWTLNWYELTEGWLRRKQCCSCRSESVTDDWQSSHWSPELLIWWCAKLPKMAKPLPHCTLTSLLWVDVCNGLLACESNTFGPSLHLRFGRSDHK